MQIDSKLISFLEDISCLSLTDDEKNCFTGELQKIMDFIEPLKELNTDGMSECVSGRNVNVFRKDEVFPSLNRDLVLKNAPVKNEEFFIAPKTVE